MGTVDVTCPYCESGTTTSIPDGTSVAAAHQSWDSGFRKKPNLVEVACAEGHQFGVSYR